MTGVYRIQRVGEEEVRAFVPFPLPPEPPLEMSLERLRLYERATMALGRLDSVSTLLPEPMIFLYAYVRREAVVSSQIEGTLSSLSDLLLFEIEAAPGVPIEEVIEVSNYAAALNHGVERLQAGYPLSNYLLREMHAILLSRGRGSTKQPGEFRRSQNWIGGTRPGNAHFVPPPPEEVESAMRDLERFLQEASNAYPPLLKAALAHVQFETIHPFLDGNGRIGRLLIVFILHHEKVLSKPLLYLSLYFKQHRSEYYRLLDLVRQEGDWEAWIDFFLEGVFQTATHAVQTARYLVDLFEKHERLLQQKGRASPTLLQVFRFFCKRPISSIGVICKETNLSFPTVSKAVERLLELGIIYEVTGHRRGRIYAYRDYLEILNRETL